jgi:hypothetical protein
MRVQFGDLNIFGIVVDGDEVDIFVAGERITVPDNQPYFPSLLLRVTGAEYRLKRNFNFMKHEELFRNIAAEEAHFLLANYETEEFERAAVDLAVLDLGPITDSAHCFFIPLFREVFLTYAPVGGARAFSVSVIPYEIIRTLELFREFLEGQNVFEIGK